MFVSTWKNVTPKIFNQEIIPLHEPAIIKGGIKNWPLWQHANKSQDDLIKYLDKRLNSNTKTVATFEANCNENGRYFFGNAQNDTNFIKIQEPLREALQRILLNGKNIKTDKTAYVGGELIKPHFPSFDLDHPLEFLLNNSEMEPRIWVGNSATISTHLDLTDNIACVVSGKRTFTFFPIEQIENLYPAPFNQTIAGAPMSLVDIDNPDFEKHPKYKEALKHAKIAELEAGDALFVPNLWWHNVRSQGDFCLMINYFWNANPNKLECPLNSLLHGLYTISHLPARERQQWQSLFNYFVFKEQGEPMGHVEDKGIFSEITPDHAYDLRDLMMCNMGFKLDSVMRGKYSK